MLKTIYITGLIVFTVMMLLFILNKLEENDDNELNSLFESGKEYGISDLTVRIIIKLISILSVLLISVLWPGLLLVGIKRLIEDFVFNERVFN